MNAGIAGVATVDQAGANNGNTPDWKGLITQTYSTDKFSLLVQERWFSNGNIGNQYVVCQTDCPVSTANNPTVDYAKMKGAFYVDIGGSYNIFPQVTAYFKIDNLLDRDPEAAPQSNTGLDVNPALYDTLGRTFRAGVRFQF